MQPRLLSLKPKKKLGLTIAPGTCEVASVNNGEAAYWVGVLPGWIIASIDGSPVNPVSVQSKLKEIKTSTERENPWKILFLKPLLKDSPSKRTIPISRLSKMSGQHHMKIVYHSPRSRSVKLQRLKALKKPKKLARDERIIKFATSKKLGLLLKEGTTSIDTITHGGVAYWAGVEQHWKILEICGEPVNPRNVEMKLRWARRVEGVYTIKFLTSQNALIHTLKKILIKPMGNVSRSIRQKQSSMGRQNQVVEKTIRTDYPLSIEPIEEETGSCASSPGISQKKLTNYGDLKTCE